MYKIDDTLKQHEQAKRMLAQLDEPWLEEKARLARKTTRLAHQ